MTAFAYHETKFVGDLDQSNAARISLSNVIVFFLDFLQEKSKKFTFVVVFRFYAVINQPYSTCGLEFGG